MKKRSGLVNVFETFGRSFLLPVSVLPAAGILKGIGSAFTNSSTIEMHPWMANQTLQIIMGFITMIGSVAFDNLPVIFAVGVVVGLAKQEKGSAALSGLLGFLVLHNTLHYLLSVSGQLVDKAAKNVEELMSLHMQTNVLGIQTMDLNVFGGIITGIVVYLVHKKAIKMQVPQVFGFFSGPRLVPILTIPAMALVALGFFFIWPYVQVGITALSFAILKSGYFGTFAYGVIERLLLPFGLHHGLNWPVRTTELGGIFTIDGHQYAGTINAYMAALQSKLPIDPMITRFSSGKFVYNMFGLPGSALAMYMAAKPEKKKMVLGLLVSATLTAIVAGITEPLEFTFIFIAPALFAVHAVLAATMATIMYAFGVVGNMGGGLIEIMTQNWIPLFKNHSGTVFAQIIIGLIFTVIYFFVFRFLILKFNNDTPGREEEENAEVKLYSNAKKKKKKGDLNTKDAFMDQAMIFLDALGGKENIQEVNNCATRLRISVNDETVVKPDAAFREGGAHGVVRNGKAFQIVVGLSVPQVRERFEELIKE